MRSQATDFTARLLKGLKNSTSTKIAALATVAMLAAIIGPPGLAVGPTQSRTNTPALPTGAAMDARAFLSSIPISFEIIGTVARLAEDHTSYPERTVGALRFPEGAIDVPWTDMAGARLDSGTGDAAVARGNTVSTPMRDDTPRLIRASATPNRIGRSDGAPSNDLRSVILFNRTGTDLNGDAEDMLDRVAATLRSNTDRIQLRAFGGNIADRSHGSRRLALRRALSVRNYLMAQGISQERITVRALGGATDGGPSDRVDVVYSDR